LAASIEWASVLLLALACIGLLCLSTPEPRSLGNKVPPRAVIAVLSAAYIIAIAFSLNGSSSAIWRFMADRKSPDAALLAGSAKEFRSDEWAVQTPWLLAQLHARPTLPVHNPNIGAAGAPLLTNLPARHWSMLFRPNMWGFLVFDAERAFAVYWNFKWFALLLGTFLFLQVITRGQVLISVAGALFLFASAYVQWWFSSPTAMPEMVAMMFFGLWGTALVLRAERRKNVVGGCVVVLFALLQFVFCSYPRFQIPLAYVAAMLVGCGCLGRPRAILEPLRCWGLAITLTSAAVLLACWYREVAPLIREIATLAYPGQVVSTGGGYSWPQLLAPFFSFTLSQENFPAVSMNVVEAAGFLFLAPFLAVAVVRDGIYKHADFVVVGCLVLSAFLVLFILVGIPLPLAKATGWSHVYGARALLPLGVVSTVALCRYLALPPRQIEGTRITEVAAFVAAALALFGAFYVANRMLGDFVNARAVLASAVFFAAAFVCVWSRRVTAAGVLLVVPLVAS
ncbi:MAG TPA: hypothetical protein VF683_09075, partial [Chthoniobacterales bacterium]